MTAAEINARAKEHHDAVASGFDPDPVELEFVGINPVPDTSATAAWRALETMRFEVDAALPPDEIRVLNADGSIAARVVDIGR